MWRWEGKSGGRKVPERGAWNSSGDGLVLCRSTSQQLRPRSPSPVRSVSIQRPSLPPSCPAFTLSCTFSAHFFLPPVFLLPLSPSCVCVHAKSLESCPVCSPMDCSPPDSSAHGISQARILEWVSMPSSRGSSRHRDGTCVSLVSCIGRGFFTTGPLGKPLPATPAPISLQHLPGLACYPHFTEEGLRHREGRWHAQSHPTKKQSRDLGLDL